VADKSHHLVVSALSRAVADPGGLPLLGGKAAPALFPATAAGKLAAQRCQDEGYLQVVAASDAARRGRGEAWTISDKGLGYLLDQVSPRQVLEDFVRALEARQAQAAELLDTARRMHQTLDALKARVEQVLPRVPHFSLPERDGDPRPLAALFAAFLKNGNSHIAPGLPGVSGEDPRQAGGYMDRVDAALLGHLERWQGSGASEDCPLPELYRRTAADVPGLTLGVFHDAVRRLHDAEKLYVHPWPGPLYDLPEPSFALLVGHLVAYYASIRR